MHLQQLLHHLLQAQQVDELVVGGRGQEVKLGGRRLRRRDLQQRLLQLLAQGELGGGLPAGRRVVDVGVGRHLRALLAGGGSLEAGTSRDHSILETVAVISDKNKIQNDFQ